jgi:hypothetical protein
MRIQNLLPVLVLLMSCSDAPEQATDRPKAPAALGPVTEDRDTWQKPEVLQELMGGELNGVVVADLFAGDGYYTFKLIEGGANVIAIDNDPANIAKLEQRKRELGLGDDRLRIRAVPVGDPGLTSGEADVALLTHRYGSIQDKGSYITRLRQGLRHPRPLYIIEWQFRETPIGPPMEERFPSDGIMEELGAYGYSDIGALGDKLPYQVVLIATDYIELDSETYDRMMDGSEVVPL